MSATSAVSAACTAARSAAEAAVGMKSSMCRTARLEMAPAAHSSAREAEDCRHHATACAKVFHVLRLTDAARKPAWHWLLSTARHWGVERMRHLVLALAGFFSMIASVMAGDVEPAKAPTAVAAPINWTGLYVGTNAGAGMADAGIFDPDCDPCTNKKFQTAFAGVGGQIGYNWQWRAMVLGLEGDLNWASAKASDMLKLCCERNGGLQRFKF